ncbi:MAG: hypothetical protein AMXMBFR13_35840 [Phycisphaerae bacterium]
MSVAGKQMGMRFGIILLRSGDTRGKKKRPGITGPGALSVNVAAHFAAYGIRMESVSQLDLERILP